MFFIKVEIIFIITSIVFNFIIYKFNSDIAKLFNLFDIPNTKRKLHKYPTPLNGGIFCFLNIFLIFVFDIFFNNLTLTSFLKLNNESEAMLLLLTFFLILIVGIIDDKISLNPMTKSLISAIIFLIFLLIKIEYQIINLRFETFNFTLDLYKLSIVFTILCFLVLQIALNMFDGIDLQSATYYSVVVIYLLGLNDSYNFHLFSILILINLLFFAINNYQKKIFLGDNGVYIFSFILSLLIIQTYQNNYNDIYVENILVILFLPVMDMMRLFFIRLLKNKSPFKADRRHIHHILLKKYGLIQANVLLILPLIFSISLMKYTDINLIFILLMNCIVYFFLLQNSNK
tara:strand:- start:1376 stop:2407 length:1032 start_codon:yes stop_codon:yes gene_type:complete